MTISRRTFAAFALALAAGGFDTPAAEAGKASLSPFAVDLYGKLAGGDGNAFYSPASIAQAFSMLYEGAKGETADEILKALRLTQADMGSALETFASLCSGADKEIELTTANSAWAEQTFPLRTAYVDILQQRYLAEGFNCDFKGKPDAERIRINQWVERKTHDRIKDLIPPGRIDPAARLILANAVYFKAKWLFPFEGSNTRSRDFMTGGKKVSAKMMNRSRLTLGHYEDDEVQAVDLPYKGKSMSMMVVLPRKVDGLPAVEKDLNSAKLARWTSGLKQENDIQLGIPKFKFTADYGLVDPLKALGMNKVFVLGQSDLTGVSDSSEAKALYVSDAIHKAFVAVDEEGTEAAAATAIIMRAGAIARPPQRTFLADHPFLFLIRDTKSGTILFMGRMADPTKE